MRLKTEMLFGAHPDTRAHDDGGNDDKQAAVEAVGNRDKEGAELGEDAEQDEERSGPDACGVSYLC